MPRCRCSSFQPQQDVRCGVLDDCKHGGGGTNTYVCLVVEVEELDAVLRVFRVHAQQDVLAAGALTVAAATRPQEAPGIDHCNGIKLAAH